MPATLKAYRKLVSQDTLWDVNSPEPITKSRTDGVLMEEPNGGFASSLIRRHSNSLFGMLAPKTRKSVSKSDNGANARDSLIGTVGSFFKSLTESATTLATDPQCASPFALDAPSLGLEDEDDDAFSSSSLTASGSFAIVDDSKEERCHFTECGSLDDCECMTRIVMVLRFYQKHYDDEDTVRLYLKTYTDFLNDYHHILDVHLNENRLGVEAVNGELKKMVCALPHHLYL